MGKSKSGGQAARVLSMGVVVCLIASACAATGTGTPPTASSSPNPSQTGLSSPAPSPTNDAAGCVVGVAWNNYTESVISEWYEPPIKKAIADAHGTYVDFDAKSAPATQASQIDELVANGAKVILLRVQGDGSGPLPAATQSAMDRAMQAGIPIVAYDYFIDSPKVLWLSFDDVEIGRAEARAILAAQPRGNYVILRGQQGDMRDARMAAGIHEILQPAIDRGDIKIVAETYTEYWDPFKAQAEMATILAESQFKIDAVITGWDGMADAVATTLAGVGLEGKVAIASQGGNYTSLRNVALGIETVNVWSNPGLLGTTGGSAALALCRNPDIAKVKGAAPFSSPGHNQIPSILLAPQTITKDNLKVILDAGWMKRADLCRDVDPSKAPPACR